MPVIKIVDKGHHGDIRILDFWNGRYEEVLN